MLRSLGRDWQLKGLSLVLAVGLWLFVGTAQRTEIALALPVEYVGLEGALALDGPRQETVDVQVQATRWSAERVSPTSLRVRVDVSGLGEGDNLVHLQPESVEAPRAHVLRRVVVQPPTVEIKGPRTTIESRTAVDTLPVDVSGYRQVVTRTVGLALPESIYAVDRRTVEVTVDIRPEETMQQR